MWRISSAISSRRSGRDENAGAMKPRAAASRSRKSGRPACPAGRGGDPVQANLLSVIACVFGAGALILPLPLGLAGMLLAGWGVWRHGRTPFGVLVLASVTALTAAGIVIGMAL
jgi:hypothetical protein